jgi:putative phosphoesterase
LAVRQAVALFDKLGVFHVIHCGDVGSPEVFDEIIGRPFTFVWGNMDSPYDGLLTYAQSLGLAIPQEVPVRIELGGKRFAVFHGHEPGFNTALQRLDVDYILHGHTHVACDEKLNGKRIINPGALHRAARKTVATLDTGTDQLTFHEVRKA